jgi:leucyl aminopeptidase (aminopeptidase T)
MDIRAGARIVLDQCLGAKRGESLLVVTDTDKRAIGEALFDEGRGMGLEAVLLVMEPGRVHGAEPPAVVAEAMTKADIVLCPTASSLTHTRARKQASERGARIATMPGITEEMFTQGAITADYAEVAKLTDRLTAMLDRAEHVRVEKEGRVLELSIAGRKGISSNGLLRTRGASGNLPTGEAYIAPVEGSASGRILFDGSVAGIGVLSAPLEVAVEHGKAVGFEGPDARRLEELLGASEQARNVGELGIGTNPKARLIGTILEDEKIYGTVHIAFGSNATFGGAVSAGVHIDGIMLAPTLALDGKVVVRDGRIRLED